MADISACFGQNCELKNQCYRHRCIKNPERQAYMETPKERPCAEFWSIEGRNDLSPIKENVQ